MLFYIIYLLISLHYLLLYLTIYYYYLLCILDSNYYLFYIHTNSNVQSNQCCYYRNLKRRETRYCLLKNMRNFIINR